jgi:4-amino-4-deoxy-L-arabinose transferase-like glycosyltransferase
LGTPHSRHDTDKDTEQLPAFNSTVTAINPKLLVAVTTALILIPFIGKAFHIDDPMFIWAAHHILDNPVDFYGFDVNWYGSEQPMYLVNQNPPLVSYFIAVAAYFFGWSEVAIHSAFLIPTIFLSLGTYYLAKIFAPKPQMAAFIAISTPAFLVSSTNIMSDVLMLSLYVWSIVFWFYGIDKDKKSYLFIAGVLIGFAVLTKYFALSLLPLLFVFSILKMRRLGIWILFLGIPIVFVIGYQSLTYYLYDSLLVSNAANYALNIGYQGTITSFFTKSIVGLSYTGGCLVGIVFFTHLIWSKRQILIAGLCLSLFYVILLTQESVRDLLAPGIGHNQYGVIFQFGLFILVGVQVLFLACNDLFKHRTPESLLLLLWIFGTFFFAVQINWTISARNILPMAPAVGILLIRKLNENDDFILPARFLKYFWPIIPAAMLAISVSHADASLANTQRLASAEIHKQFETYPHQIWFQGHWGFQYYMEELGATAVEFNKSRMDIGDLVIIPTNSSNTRPLPKETFQYIDLIQLESHTWVGTMSANNFAGFYWGGNGPLPFAFGEIEPEKYLIFRGGGIDGNSDPIKQAPSKL